VVALVAGAFSCYASAGCLSNEYRISRSELQRIAQLPPATRGAHVRVVQDLGDRRGPAVEAQAAPVPYEPGPGWDGSVEVHGSFDGRFDGGRPPSAAPSRGSGGGGHVAAAGGWHGGGAAPRASGSGGGGGWHTSGGGGGGGGGGGDAAAVLAVVAIVVVAVAAFAVVGFAATEGARYDGYADLAPEQPVYLVDARGGQREVALGALTDAELADVVVGVVKDDEGFGLSRTGRAPLDRKGIAFKLDVGQLETALDHYSVGGLAANVQLGYFPWRRVGLLGTLALTGGDDDLGHTFVRHSAALELQAFPIELGPLHLGGYVNGGRTVLADAGGERSGPSVSGGALVELAVTTRLAITFRAGWGGAWLPARAGEPPGERWSPSAVFTGGLAIY
jgi:hypothetical protein